MLFTSQGHVTPLQASWNTLLFLLTKSNFFPFRALGTNHYRTAIGKILGHKQKKKKKIPRKQNKTKTHPGVIFLLTFKSWQSTKKKKKFLKNSNLYHSHSSEKQTSQVGLWQSWSNSAQCWEELWSRTTLYQAHIKSVLTSIICKTQRADPECHSESPQSCWAWISKFTYLDIRPTGFEALASSLFSINFAWLSPSHQLFWATTYSAEFSPALSHDVQAVTDAVTPRVTPWHCSSPRPQERAKAPQNRGCAGFREEISKESWHLHWGHAYLLCCHQQRFPQIKCIKLCDRGNTWPKTAKRTQAGHAKRLQRCETKNNHHLYLLWCHTFLSSVLPH